MPFNRRLIFKDISNWGMWNSSYFRKFFLLLEYFIVEAGEIAGSNTAVL
jgi:hypothetical protein